MGVSDVAWSEACGTLHLANAQLTSAVRAITNVMQSSQAAAPMTTQVPYFYLCTTIAFLQHAYHLQSSSSSLAAYSHSQAPSTVGGMSAVGSIYGSHIWQKNPLSTFVHHRRCVVEQTLAALADGRAADAPAAGVDQLAAHIQGE